MAYQKMQLRAERTLYGESVSLYGFVSSGEKQFVATDVVLGQREEGLASEPFVSLSMRDAQTLMDDLWYAGLRPTEGAGSAGALRAVENHLSDMRKIAFNRLKIEGQ